MSMSMCTSSRGRAVLDWELGKGLAGAAGCCWLLELLCCHADSGNDAEQLGNAVVALVAISPVPQFCCLLDCCCHSCFFVADVAEAVQAFMLGCMDEGSNLGHAHCAGHGSRHVQDVLQYEVAELTIEQPSPYGDVSDALGWLLGVVAE
eukprot:529993-Pelagomonas_calceolata.AAC.1